MLMGFPHKADYIAGIFQVPSITDVTYTVSGSHLGVGYLPSSAKKHQ
jgi:hypothetical protein